MGDSGGEVARCATGSTIESIPRTIRHGVREATPTSASVSTIESSPRTSKGASEVVSGSSTTAHAAWVDRYLAHIGESARPPSVDALFALQTAHLDAVPYETLDVVARRKPAALGLAASVERIVGRGRGGYCFQVMQFYLQCLAVPYL